MSRPFINAHLIPTVHPQASLRIEILLFGHSCARSFYMLFHFILRGIDRLPLPISPYGPYFLHSFIAVWNHWITSWHYWYWLPFLVACKLCESGTWCLWYLEKAWRGVDTHSWAGITQLVTAKSGGEPPLLLRVLRPLGVTAREVLSSSVGVFH